MISNSVSASPSRTGTGARQTAERINPRFVESTCRSQARRAARNSSAQKLIEAHTRRCLVACFEGVPDRRHGIGHVTARHIAAGAASKFVEQIDPSFATQYALAAAPASASVRLTCQGSGTVSSLM